MQTSTNEITNEIVAQALRALDFTEENARVAALNAEITDAEAAIAKAEARRTEISRALIELRGPDGRAVADALLDQVDARDAARSGPTQQEQIAERESLRAGILELQARIRTAQEQIGKVQADAMSRAGVAVAPLAADAIAKVRALAEPLFDAFAVLDAIAEATRSHGRERGEARAAVNGLAGPSGAVPWRRSVPVPAEVQAVLYELTGKGPALPVRLIANAQPH